LNVYENIKYEDLYSGLLTF